MARNVGQEQESVQFELVFDLWQKEKQLFTPRFSKRQSVERPTPKPGDLVGSWPILNRRFHEGSGEVSVRFRARNRNRHLSKGLPIRFLTEFRPPEPWRVAVSLLQAIYSLVGMGPPGIKRAEEMVAAPWMEKAAGGCLFLEFSLTLF